MAWGVSDDGQLVAGEAFLGGGQWRGFYWTPSSDGPQILPEPSGSEGLYLATAVSASGNVIVGCSGRNIQQSVRWLKNQQGTWVPEPIGSLGGTGSFPHAVSEQGNIVVGRSTLPDGRERAYKWVSGQGMQNLGTIGNLQSRAWGVSLDGSVVLGDVYVTGFSGMRAVRWTEQGGIEDLNQTYSSLLNGSLLETARHISANKRFIVGYGINSRTNRREVYVLDVKFREDVDGSGCVDMSDVWYIFIRLINGIACPECDANGDGVANFA
ncbi:MAG: hypothetical protein NZM10_07670, partial [Fimbriimonadales bacterium]|nr:hypothetical protein [Fimbriimonadales bacterium]